MKIEEYLNTAVRDFSNSVIYSRAIPSVIDGFKPSQRKIIYTANKTAKSFIKTTSLVGLTISTGGYDKGDTSIEDAIGIMTQKFAGANNYPLLDGDGSFGGRLKPNGIAAGRYTKSKISKYFDIFFKDTELLEYAEQDGEYFEPIYYLPVIPTVLLNGVSGIAVGYATEILSYNKEDIKNNILNILNGKKQKRLRPYYDGFKGTIEYDEELQKWIMYGVHEVLNTTKVEITEIPIGISHEKYCEHLIALQDKGIIKNYVDKSKQSDFHFIVDFSRESLANLIEKNTLLKTLKLVLPLSENINTISEDIKLLHFNNANDLIEYFVNFRLGVYTKRKEYKIQQFIQENIDYLNEIKVIEALINETITIKNIKTKKDMIAMIKSVIEDKNITDDKLNKLCNIPLYNINQEQIDNINDKIKKNIENIEYYRNVDIKELYKKDLASI